MQGWEVRVGGWGLEVYSKSCGEPLKALKQQGDRSMVGPGLWGSCPSTICRKMCDRRQVKHLASPFPSLRWGW